MISIIIYAYTCICIYKKKLTSMNIAVHISIEDQTRSQHTYLSVCMHACMYVYLETAKGSLNPKSGILPYPRDQNSPKA